MQNVLLTELHQIVKVVWGFHFIHPSSYLLFNNYFVYLMLDFSFYLNIFRLTYTLVFYLLFLFRSLCICPCFCLFLHIIFFVLYFFLLITIHISLSSFLHWNSYLLVYFVINSVNFYYLHFPVCLILLIFCHKILLDLFLCLSLLFCLFVWFWFIKTTNLIYFLKLQMYISEVLSK